MKRTFLAACTAGTLFFVPAAAYAASGESVVAVPVAARIGVSLMGLVIGLILLLEAKGLRSVALGGAIAEKISFVVLAIICLATSAIVQWLQNFVPAMSGDVSALAAQVLVVIAMGLFAAYFYSVRSALNRYLKAMTGSEMLAKQAIEDAKAQVADEESLGA